MKIGIFEEDGWIAEVEILEDTSDKECFRYKFKVIKTLREPIIFKTPTDGDVFNVDQVKDQGAWSGMWHIHDIKEVKDGEVIR